MSFLEYLISKGFNYDVASAICVKVDNDLPLTEDQERFFNEWLDVIEPSKSCCTKGD